MHRECPSSKMTCFRPGVQMTVEWSETFNAFRSYDLISYIRNFSKLLFFLLYNQDMSENINQQAQQQAPQVQQQQPSTTQHQTNQNQDLANCDLANLESLNCNDSDELLRQLTENTFELETFFSEFSTADIKVNIFNYL